MPLQETSGAASYDAFGGGVPVAGNYIEDVFSTWLYTGTGATRSITNGIDLAGKGGLVWIKDRSLGTRGHVLYDTARGGDYLLTPSGSDSLTATNGSTLAISSSIAFNSAGFSLGTDSAYSVNNFYTTSNYVSWTFRKQPKFFDVVTYTGNGSSSQTIAHNLGSAPGCIIVKRTDSTSDWYISHRSESLNMKLNTDEPVGYSPSLFINNGPTSTTFTVGQVLNTNAGTFVAYIFAHNAGGFGLTGTDNVISCGSWTGGASVVLGYEPQWLLIKNTSASQNWFLIDNMRGLNAAQGDQAVSPNTAGAEPTASSNININSTGFQAVGLGADPYIYIAIRRGPMKVPTIGTSVFEHFTYIGDNTNPRFIPGTFPVDVALTANVNDVADKFLSANRLTGNRYAVTLSATAQTTNTNLFPSNAFSARQNGLNIGSSQNSSLNTYLDYFFRRAPQFFDVVCYTGNGASNQVLNHNLGVAPELIINKKRSSVHNWAVAHSLTPTTLYGNIVNSAGGQASFGPIAYSANAWLLNAVSTATTITVGSGSDDPNDGGATYFTYLFATCPGVSKVGSYTGTGTTQVIDCGFTSGARFILIKAASTTGNWLVWDTVRSIGPSAEPYLTLNTTAAQVNGTDWVDPDSSGFELSNAAGNLANTNGVSYIFLAIA